ncbi:MAG: hypothetical protein AB1714_01545 [Acidobacteriota bacterium]
MLLAFLSTGDPGDAARARLLGDSLVWAQQHDEIPDGRIRNVYYPDDLATGTTYGNKGDVARHNYDKYGNGVGPGNMSWAMVALLDLYQRLGGDEYKESALAMGRWIVKNSYSTTGAGGYTAGVNGWESNTCSASWRGRSSRHLFAHGRIISMGARVYVETSVISYLVARPSRNILAAAWQEVTREWWEKRRSRFELFTSELVLAEAGQNDPEAGGQTPRHSRPRRDRRGRCIGKEDAQ